MSRDDSSSHKRGFTRKLPCQPAYIAAVSPLVKVGGDAALTLLHRLSHLIPYLFQPPS
jgi:hypothetical protein